MVNVKQIIDLIDSCFIPGIILLLEDSPIVAKIYIFTTILLLIIVDIDKGRLKRYFDYL